MHNKLARLFLIMIFDIFMSINIVNAAQFHKYINAILEIAPCGWKIAKICPNLVPNVFYNKFPPGQLIILSGPNNVMWNWKDADGKPHRESFAKESLEIWLFPPNYFPGIRTYINIKGQILPINIYESRNIKVYANHSHMLLITDYVFQEFVGKAKAMYWDDSVKNYAISWSEWRHDIVMAIKSAEEFD